MLLFPLQLRDGRYDLLIEEFFDWGKSSCKLPHATYFPDKETVRVHAHAMEIRVNIQNSCAIMN